MSKLTQDLHSVAGIVGSLGLSIAAAQREMNRDYLEAIERLSVVAISLLQGKKTNADGTAADLTEADRTFIKEFLTKFAPARYQYTRTHLEVRLDLAQSLSAAASGSLGGSIGAVAVNASAAVTYGSQYQAAAECKTVIDAVQPTDDLAFFGKLTDLANSAQAKSLTLPARAAVDEATVKTSQSIIQKLLNITPATITDSKP